MTQKDATTAAAVLRVLEGPQKGARLVLQSRRYLFGSGDDCDVILADDGIGAVHAEVQVDLAQITLTARDGDVVLKDRIVSSGDTAEITLPSTLLFGDTVVGIGAGDTDWNAMPAPDRAAIEAAEQAARAAAEKAEAEAEAEAEQAEAATEASAEASAEAGTATASEAPEGDDAETAPDTATSEQVTDGSPDDVRAPRPRKRTAMLIAASVLAIAIAGGGIYLATGGDDTTTVADAPAAAVEAPVAPAMTQAEVAAFVKERGFDDVFVSEGDNGEMAIWGYVQDPVAHDALVDALNERNVTFRDDTRRVDQLMSSVNTALSAFSWPVESYPDHLRVSYIGSGSVEVDGFLGQQVDRAALTRVLKSDVPGLNIVRFHRANLPEWRAILDTRLANAGLDKWLETNVNGDRIRISGELTPLEAKSWRTVGEAFVAESRGWPALEIAVTLATGKSLPAIEAVEPAPEPVTAAETTPDIDADRPDIRLIGVIVGGDGNGRALLSDGESVSVGDITEDGAEVVQIQQHSMVLRFNGKEFTYHMRSEQ